MLHDGEYEKIRSYRERQLYETEEALKISGIFEASW